MTELQSLLAAVLHNPDDNAVRLIYADALEETGIASHVARAELIRLQVADEGATRQHELLEKWLPSWLPESICPPLELVYHLQDEWWRCPRCEFAFSRGFISAVQSPPVIAEGDWPEDGPERFADKFAATVAALFDEHPVEKVTVDLIECETFQVMRFCDADQWECITSGFSKPKQFWASDRDNFGRELRRTVYGRLVSIGNHILHV